MISTRDIRLSSTEFASREPMRKSKFSESQIVAILKEGEAGLPVAEVCRKHGISAPTYYAWKSKYAGATVSDLALENAAIKDVLAKKF